MKEHALTSTSLPLSARAEEAAEEVVADILALVEVESHSGDRAGLDAALEHLLALAGERLGDGVLRRHPGGVHGDTVTVTFEGTGPGHVAMVGHYDTVWPPGTLAGWGPRDYVDAAGRRRLSGPGIFDMKAGLVQGVWALRLLRETGAPTPTVTFLFNGDEEIGSLSSRPVIEEVGGRVDATLVTEPSAGGAVKTGRKGIGIFEVTFTGVESHAGLDPAAGASAIHALAEFVTAAVGLAAPKAGTTINAGIVSGGSGTNVVAGSATARFDIRVESDVEMDRVDAGFDAIVVSEGRVEVKVDHGWNRPPMTLTPVSAPLLRVAEESAAELGRNLEAMSVGGASDANFVAGLGKPVLCGLGAVGAGAHARGEFIYPDQIAPQTTLVAGMLARLADGQATSPAAG